MIAAEHERKAALRDDVLHDVRKLVADRFYDREVLRVLLRDGRRLGHRHAQVAVIGHGDAQALERLFQARVADRGRAHVDAAAVGAQIHRDAHDVDARDEGAAGRDGGRRLGEHQGTGG